MRHRQLIPIQHPAVQTTTDMLHFRKSRVPFALTCGSRLSSRLTPPLMCCSFDAVVSSCPATTSFKCNMHQFCGRPAFFWRGAVYLRLLRDYSLDRPPYGLISLRVIKLFTTQPRVRFLCRPALHSNPVGIVTIKGLIAFAVAWPQSKSGQLHCLKSLCVYQIRKGSLGTLPAVL